MMCQQASAPFNPDDPEGFQILLWRDVEYPNMSNCGALNFSLYELGLVESAGANASAALGQLSVLTPKVNVLVSDVTSLKAQVLALQSGGSGSSTATAVFPWNMSAADGAVLGAAILAVWAGAFAIRAVIRALRSDEIGGSEGA